ncbi:hypothetical protein K491DRAFT_225781 [Lophiostoma macrostomum CBS 122681]|uniref:Uncharacterized protein n=1 Tax=Lophiostoma macrostomum CBS 122681 TaxID=1314788 RepID=A0A6A6TII4_9PLEO|nr:hypothetical protein K491DRAFT_225781 [Lophiostoma macrostomum CBS 122681]
MIGCNIRFEACSIVKFCSDGSDDDCPLSLLSIFLSRIETKTTSNPMRNRGHAGRFQRNSFNGSPTRTRADNEHRAGDENAVPAGSVCAETVVVASLASICGSSRPQQFRFSSQPRSRFIPGSSERNVQAWSSFDSLKSTISMRFLSADATICMRIKNDSLGSFAARKGAALRGCRLCPPAGQAGNLG